MSKKQETLPAKVYMTTFYGQVRPKKNAKTIGYRAGGQPFIRTKTDVKAQENMMAQAFQIERMQQRFSIEQIADMDIEVEIDFYNSDLNRHDLDNQLATVMDALVKAEVLPDDNQKVVRKETVRYMGIDKADPRAEVTIKAFTKTKGRTCR